MSAKILIKIITFLVFAVVVLTPFFYIKPSVYPFVFDKALFLQSLIEILFALWVVLAIYDPRYRFFRKSDFPRKFDFLILASLGFAAALVIVSFTGVDPWRSFFSTYERAFGVFAMAHMAAFALVSASLWRELPWRLIFAASIAASAVVGATAATELKIANFLLDQPFSPRTGGTFGNPSFLAGYLSWNVFLALYFLLSRVFGPLREAGAPERKLARGGPGGAAAGRYFSEQGGAATTDDSCASLGMAATASNGGRKKLLSAIDRIFFSWPWLSAVILFDLFVIIFVTQTRGNILGLVAGFFVLLVLFAIRPPGFGASGHSGREQGIPAVAALTGSFGYRVRTALSSRAAYIVVLILIVAGGAAFWATRASDIWEGIPGIERFRDISLFSEDLQPRIIALRAAWQGFLERPVFGWGPENFNIVFNKHYDPKALRVSYQETRFDKPHNFLAEDAVAGGTLLLLARLAFFAAFIFAALRLKDKLFGQIAIAAFASYFVGNLFLFDTIGSTLLLFVVAGFLAGGEAENRQTDAGAASRQAEPRYPAQRKITGDVPFFSFAVALTASLAFAYAININTMRASYYHFLAFHDVARGIDTDRSRLPLGIAEFRKALDIWHPYRWNFARDYAAVMSQTYFYNPTVIPKDAVLDAINEMEKVAREHPLDAYNHYSLVDMYNQIADIDPERFLPAAEREAAIALKLSPNRQQVYFSLAKTKTLQNNYLAAIELARHALSLDDKVADSHFYYGLLLLANKNTDEGQAEIKEAIRLGRKWKNFYEPLTVGNLLADAGKIEDAIELYAIAVIMSQGIEQLEPKTKLGLAFYVSGKLKEAREELQYVADRFDFRSSESFKNLKPVLDELGVRY